MDWTLAMALEAGVWGKAQWLALCSHLEGLLPLASVPQHLLSLPSLKSCIQCVESQLLVVITSVCVKSVSLGMCVRVCSGTCIYVPVPCSLLLGQDAVPGSQSCLLHPQCLSLREGRCSWMPILSGLQGQSYTDH